MKIRFFDINSNTTDLTVEGFKEIDELYSYIGLPNDTLYIYDEPSGHWVRFVTQKEQKHYGYEVLTPHNINLWREGKPYLILQGTKTPLREVQTYTETKYVVYDLPVFEQELGTLNYIPPMDGTIYFVGFALSKNPIIKNREDFVFIDSQNNVIRDTDNQIWITRWFINKESQDE